MEQRDKDVAAVAAVLGKPAGFDISESAIKVRKSLMAASIALLCLVIAKIEPNDTFTIFGVAFKGVTADKIVIGGMSVLVYSLIHFISYILELLIEYRVRATGARLAFQTGTKAGSQYVDYPDDPKQSSLLNWWKSYAHRLNVVEELADKVNTDLEEIKRRIENIDEISRAPDMATTSQLMGQVNASLINISSDLKTSREVIMSPRIEASLQRYETWHKNLITLQGLRVVILEVMFPILLGVISLVSALKYLSTH
ncbi:hypothetical protein [Pseudomonas brassicacearum]|uniref:hypothetical protein n=1 Tax=Pseudomonas brassicacearum TaxID=930166 RepID=UPI0011CDBCB6|nr:hypothetical protein [Pseudomonas brassicacearum]